jgi:predicted nucleic acid-binding protein
MTLADTSIWRRHIRQTSPKLQALLERQLIGIHPFVTGEIACGNLRDRDVLLYSFAELPQARIAPEIEVRHMLEEHRLWGTGLSWIDVHILTSATMMRWQLYTADSAMIAAAARMRVPYLLD